MRHARKDDFFLDPYCFAFDIRCLLANASVSGENLVVRETGSQTCCFLQLLYTQLIHYILNARHTPQGFNACLGHNWDFKMCVG